jgi:hypothetical protein
MLPNDASLWELPERSVEGPNPAWTAKGPGYSLAFFCPRCGYIWGRRWLYSGGVLQQFISYSRACVDCPGWGDEPPGSIWSLLLHEDIAVLPDFVVEREFHLYLDHAEKRNV